MNVIKSTLGVFGVTSVKFISMQGDKPTFRLKSRDTVIDNVAVEYRNGQASFVDATTGTAILLSLGVLESS